jgi:hypothetical protein
MTDPDRAKVKHTTEALLNMMSSSSQDWRRQPEAALGVWALTVPKRRTRASIFIHCRRPGSISASDGCEPFEDAGIL